MINPRAAMVSGLLATLLGLVACSNAPVTSNSNSNYRPNTTAMTARLAGANEVPPTTSNASGMVDADFDKQTRVLSWTITYTGLSGPATAGHFHGPAEAGVNAGVALPLTGSLDSPIKGMTTLDAAQSGDLMSGKWYMNLHTAANPNGEIRGQVSARP